MDTQRIQLQPLDIELEDTEWPFTFTDHDRQIVRAIVVDAAGNYCFVRAVRDDEFGAATLIETSGGGVEPGEDLNDAIRRELREELGAEVEILGKIGVVRDYYNLIHRHNINHYFLCRARSFGKRHLTQDETDKFHLSTLKLCYEDAVAEYERRACTPLGRLIANRELPVLRRAKAMLDGGRKACLWCFGDSNTYGYDPRGFSGGRYAAPWPERLAEQTGFEVINDGRNGRRIPAGESAFRQFRMEAERYGADALIVMLGVNDLLEGASADEAAAWMEAFLVACAMPRVLLIGPPPMKRGAWVPDDRLVEASRALARQYRALAERLGTGYVDAGAWEIPLAYDGVHFSETGHARFADGLAALLSEMEWPVPAGS